MVAHSFDPIAFKSETVGSLEFEADLVNLESLSQKQSPQNKQNQNNPLKHFNLVLYLYFNNLTYKDTSLKLDNLYMHLPYTFSVG